MKRIFLSLLTLLILIGCSYEDKLKFPNSSYGKAMQCMNENYYGFFEQMTGEKSFNGIKRISQFCSNKFQEDVETALYTGRANFDKNSILSNVNIYPRNEVSEQVLNHLLTEMSFEVTLFSKRDNGDGVCEDINTTLSGTTIDVSESSNSINSASVEMHHLAYLNIDSKISDLADIDKCFKDWLESDEVIISASNFKSGTWSWNIKNAKGLYY